MKSLNEVIKANECCDHGEPDSRCKDCPYNGIGACCLERESDALHYLKKYHDNYEARNDQIKRYQKAAQQCEKVLKDYITLKQIALRQYCAEAQNNPPLTWDELKRMEGKPVWVEILSDEIDLSSRWMLVARETKAHSLPLAYTDDIGHWIFGHEDKLGKTWQAYRKERFNTEYEDIPMECFENGGI